MTFSPEQLETIRDEFFGMANDLAMRNAKKNIKQEDWKDYEKSAWKDYIAIAEEDDAQWEALQPGDESSNK